VSGLNEPAQDLLVGNKQLLTAPRAQFSREWLTLALLAPTTSPSSYQCCSIRQQRPVTGPVTARRVWMCGFSHVCNDIMHRCRALTLDSIIVRPWHPGWHAKQGWARLKNNAGLSCHCLAAVWYL